MNKSLEVNINAKRDKMTTQPQVKIRRQCSNMSIKRTLCDSVQSLLNYGLISFLLIIVLNTNFSSAEEWLRNTYNTRYVARYFILFKQCIFKFIQFITDIRREIEILLILGTITMIATY